MRVRPYYSYQADLTKGTNHFRTPVRVGLEIMDKLRGHTLKVANYFAGPSSQSRVLEEFCRELEKRTDGQVKVDYYPGQSLLSGTAMFDGIVKGIADIGYSHVFYTSGRMPVTEAMGLPIDFSPVPGLVVKFSTISTDNLSLRNLIR